MPILQNQFMPDGFVSLQFIPRGPQMQQGAAMPAGAPSVQAQANSAPGEWPFAKKEELRIQEAPAEELEPAVPPEIAGAAPRPGICGLTEGSARQLYDLSRCTGDSPSVTDVLIKALDDVDRIKQVVVIRVHNNQDVDLSLNCNQFEATGILEKARIWLAMRER